MMNNRRILLITILSFITFFILTQLLTQLATHPAFASPLGTTDSCYAYDGNSVYSSQDSQALQQAVDDVEDGAFIKVAGVCRGAQTHTNVTQTVYISKSITIQGGYTTTNWLTPNASLNPTILDAQNSGRVVYITGPIQVILENLIIRNGQIANGNGGGIYHNATLNESGSGIYQNSGLTVTNSIIANNTASGSFPYGFGGGIASAEGQLLITNSLITGNNAVVGGGLLIFLGQTTINNSMIEGNSASESGGGVILGFGTLTMTSSTLAYNQALLDGGGIENDADSSVYLLNSTVSGNTAVRSGGGVDNFNNAVMTITNSTISHNTAGVQGGGIYNSATLIIDNTIVANSSGGDCWQLGSPTDIIDNGFNLIEDGSCGMVAGGDPLLGPLTDNGGKSWTHALLEGSPAMDTGNCANGTNMVDQRGVSRPQGTGCDIGAFELEQPTLYLPIILK